MSTILKLEHIQKYYGNEGNITKAIQETREEGSRLTKEEQTLQK